MKSRFWVLGMVFDFLGLMVFAFLGSPGRTAPSPNATRPIIMWDPDEMSWIPNSHAQLLMIVDRLQRQIDAVPSKGPLTPAMISQIADVYGDDGSLTGSDGLTLRGKRDISLYFARFLDCHKVTDFKIEIKFVYGNEFTDTFGNLKNPEDIVHSIYFILCISYVLDGQAVRLPGSASYAHTGACGCRG